MTCSDYESTLMQSLSIDSIREILFLANLIDSIPSDEYKCIVTEITRSDVIFLLIH